MLCLYRINFALITIPRPVAEARPPRITTSTGLPVTTPGHGLSLLFLTNYIIIIRFLYSISFNDFIYILGVVFVNS